METSITKEIAPLAGEARKAMLGELRDQYRGTSSEAQQSRLLEALRSMPISTFDARRHLDIVHPAGRVRQLRQRGWDIATQWTVEYSEVGKPHRIAVYSLQSHQKLVQDVLSLIEGAAW